MNIILILTVLLSYLNIQRSCTFLQDEKNQNPLHGPITQDSSLYFSTLVMNVEQNKFDRTESNYKPVISDDEKLIVYSKTPYLINVYDLTKNGQIIFQINIFGSAKRFQFSQDSKCLYVIIDKGQYLEFNSYNLSKKSLITSQFIEPFADVYIFEQINVLAGRIRQVFYQYPLKNDRTLDLNGKYAWECPIIFFKSFNAFIKFALPPKQDRQPYVYISALLQIQQPQYANQTEFYLIKMKLNYIEFIKQGSIDYKLYEIRNHVFLGVQYFDIVFSIQDSLLYLYGNQIYDLGNTYCNSLNYSAIFSQLSGNNERTILCCTRTRNLQAEYIKISDPSGGIIQADFIDIDPIKVGYIAQTNHFSGYLSKQSNYLLANYFRQEDGFRVLIPTANSTQ